MLSKTEIYVMNKKKKKIKFKKNQLMLHEGQHYEAHGLGSVGKGL